MMAAGEGGGDEDMKSKDQRIKNLFNPASGRAVMIPMDHGINGVMEGLEDPLRAFTRFAKLGVESVLMNFGIIKLIQPLLREMKNNNQDPPGIIMGMDFNQRWPKWKTPIDGDVILGHFLRARVEQAVKYDVDAVKVYFALGLEPAVQLSVVRNITELVAESDRYDMPLMIEPVTEGKYIPEDRKNDPVIIADGCRIAVELGADILKPPYPGNRPGDKEAFASICANAHVPVVMLGGVKKNDARSIFRMAQDGIEAGARGTIFGRNVWQRPEHEMEKVVKGLQDIVHRGAGTEETLDKYHLV
jgi:class I fructose-bisphosphate aldolase